MSWAAVAQLVGPPRANGRGVSVEFLSFCISFVSRRAYGSFSSFVSLVFAFFKSPCA